MLEYIFPPAPGDTAMLLASTLAGASVLPPVTTFILMVLGSCLGGMIAYYLGSRVGRPILNSILFKYLGASHSERAERVFRSHAGIVLCGNRFLPGVRGIMLPLAGILSHPAKHTFTSMALSNLAWCSLIFGLGYLFGGNLEVTERIFRSYTAVLAVGFTVIILSRLWLSYRSCSR